MSNENANIESSVEKEIEKDINMFKSLTKDEKNAKISDAIRMIEYHRAGTDAVEEKRNRVYENSLTIIGAIVAALTIIFSISDPSSYTALVYGLMVFLFAQFFVQLATVIVYYIQSDKKYPFNNPELVDKKYSNQWKWFYRGHSIISTIPVSACSSQGESEEVAKKYLLGLEKTINMHLSESQDAEYFSSITQMHLLMVHNAYKNKFYLELIEIQKTGGIISIVATIIYVIIIITKCCLLK